MHWGKQTLNLCLKRIGRFLGLEMKHFVCVYLTLLGGVFSVNQPVKNINACI